MSTGTDTDVGTASAATQSARDLPDITFDQVDWSEYETEGIDFTPILIAEIAAFGLLTGLFLYDYFVVPNGEATLTWPFVWDVTKLDYTFILTVLGLFFHGVVPAYKNKRLTMYYWQEFKKNRAAVISLAYLGVLFVVGTVGPLLIEKPELSFSTMTHPPVGITAAPTGEAITGTWAHPLGTDQQGKDILKLMIFGARVSLEVGLIGMLILIVIGTTVGATAAFFGGLVDEVLMRYVDIQMTFPAFMLLLLFVYLFGGSLFMVILLYGVLSWEGTARLVRGEALQKREEPFMKAAKTFGASNLYIIRNHLVPNVSRTVVTNATLIIPGFIIAEAGLSFLGLGDPDAISWGQVISSGRSVLDSAPWIATIPGIALFVTILAFNFVGDAAQDALDPRKSN
ncbi:ABC transporter permease [Haladaptatus salinisoli]|uniref:ABC transporter permease n=1 Tax=Haladaptatus salinisoli TaxID=2884876 RepID=UPI001D0A5705|nr:ABC transporter permease [Haladaptatus salinisoli]